MGHVSSGHNLTAQVGICFSDIHFLDALVNRLLNVPLHSHRLVMPSSFRSARHKKLAEIISESRQRAGMHQADVAKQLGRHQPFIANIESGQRRVDVVELLELARVIGFDPHELIDNLLQIEEE